MCLLTCFFTSCSKNALHWSLQYSFFKCSRSFSSFKPKIVVKQESKCKCEMYTSCSANCRGERKIRGLRSERFHTNPSSDQLLHFLSLFLQQDPRPIPYGSELGSSALGSTSPESQTRGQMWGLWEWIQAQILSPICSFNPLPFSCDLLFLFHVQVSLHELHFICFN